MDFQCFDVCKLDCGIQNLLDVMMMCIFLGYSYVMLGLYVKYFDQDMMLLVEVVQDICGCYDVFVMVCVVKYYDDIGYLGYVNCLDNFNVVLVFYGVDF